MTVLSENLKVEPQRRRNRIPRLLVAGLSLVLGILVVIGLDRYLPSELATILLDRDGLTYPWSIQNLMWVVFLIGLGEIAIRYSVSRAESKQVSLAFLPEDERTLLEADDLGAIYRRVRDSEGAMDLFLPRLIQRLALQFQVSHSAEQANVLLNSSLELYMHEIDLRYGVLRYIQWLLPTLGFSGTVIGIGLALGYAGQADVQDPQILSETTRRLAVAFNTTLLALLLSAVIVLLMNLVQSKEESALNAAGQYCVDNLINRLYGKSE